MRKFIAAGNWKLNKSISETTDFFEEFLPGLKGDESCEIIVAPVYLSIPVAVEKTKGSQVKIAGQNCYSENNGAFTGEVSASFLKSAGCSHIIIGHSERRAIFHESNEIINAKLKICLEEGLVPIFCIGETLQQREDDLVEKVLKEQLVEGLKGLDISSKDLIVAYEPVWAIGTGKVASKEDAQAAHVFIRKTLKGLVGSEVADRTRILYGGSVKPENIDELISQPDIDGGLVGGASLKASSFNELVKSISSHG